MIRIASTGLLAFGLMVASMPPALAQPAQDELTQYIFNLKNNPNDTVLREQIIKHVQTMKRPPKIPEDARRYFIEGNALLKAAKDQQGYELAIDAYRQCLLIAPWWPDANYNHAVALELANHFDSAMNALKLYIATNPGEDEARKAQDRIYEIGAKKLIAAREREESSPEAVAAREQRKLDEWLRKLNGRRYTLVGRDFTVAIDIRDKYLILGWIDPVTGGFHELEGPSGRVEIKGRETTVPTTQHLPNQRIWATSGTYIISEDGEKITVRVRYTDGDTRDEYYHWQR